jgi:hypothetical protein
MTQSRYQMRVVLPVLLLAFEVLGCSSRIRIEVTDTSAGRPNFRFSSNMGNRGVDMDYLTVEAQATKENVCFLLIADPHVRGIEAWQYGQAIPGARMEGCVLPLAGGRYRVRIKAGNGTWPYKDFEVALKVKP